jgi:hypothetical protein
MADNKVVTVLIIGALIVAAFFLFKGGSPTGNQSGEGLLIRTVPADGNGNFEVVYSSNQSGKWVAVVEDKVSSNCQFSNGKSEYKTVIIGDGPGSQTMSVSGENCIFSGGDYDFYAQGIEEKLIKFTSQTVQ